jgi:uncharacterized OsmC-like protein
MAEELTVTEVRSRTVVGVPGRSVNSSRTHHFVIDEPASMGGPGEELTPAEVFLAGVSGCGVLLVESFARKDGVPLREARAQIQGIRLKSDPANFREVRLDFELVGVTAAQGEQLVEKFKGR